MRNSLGDKIRLQHILDAILEIELRSRIPRSSAAGLASTK